MEKYSELISSVVLVVVIAGVIGPLVAVLKYFKKQNQQLDEGKSAKKFETPLGLK